MTLVSVKWQGNNQAWFTANAAVVFDANITIYCNEAPNYGQYKYTDGVTALSALAWLGGVGGGSVDSVNGQTGVVVLDAADVGADAAGTAAAAVASRPFTLFKSTNPASHTGDTNTTKIISIPIAAGMVQPNDHWRICARKIANNSNNHFLRVLVNHTDTLVGATQLGRYLSGISSLYFVRNFWFNNTLSAITVLRPASNYASDESAQTLQVSDVVTIAFDFSIPFYFIYEVQNAVGTDTVTIYEHSLDVRRGALIP